MKQKNINYNIGIALTFLRNYIRERIKAKNVEPEDVDIKSLREWLIKKTSDISGASQRAVIRYIRLNK